MITGVVGLPGEGKTLWASKQIKIALDNDEIVFSNVHVNDDRNWYYYEKFDLLAQVQRALIVLDEAQVYMNSRKWKDFSPEFQAFLQQHRHQGVDLYALTQNLNRVDVTFRELVQSLWQVEKHFIFDKFGFLFGRFRLRELAEPPTGYVETGEVSAFWAGPKSFEYYDTQSRKPKELFPMIAPCTICGKDHMLIGWYDDIPLPPPSSDLLELSESLPPEPLRLS